MILFFVHTLSHIRILGIRQSFELDPEILFDQLDYCQFLFCKKILSHFDSFIKVVVLDA